jgi:HMG (high mobility group) box
MDGAKVEPKANLTSYFIFGKEQRKLNPNTRVKEIAKRWRALKPEEKVKYQILAQKDKERFIKESLVFDQAEEKAEIPSAAETKKVKSTKVPKNVNKN